MHTEFTLKAVEAIKASCEKLCKDIDELEGQLNPKTPPAVPDGYELLTIDENTVRMEGDMCARNDGSWQEITTTTGIKYRDSYPYNPKAFYCRPIKKDFDKEWWKRGEYVLNSDGHITLFTRLIKTTTAGFQFESKEKANDYYDWLTKNAGRLRALQQLETRIAELNEGCTEPFEADGSAYMLRCNDDSVSVIRDMTSAKEFKALRFPVKRIGEQLIKEFGEDFIKQALGF